MSAHAALRAATARDHEAVDAAFGRFTLSSREGYAGFLTAHARALPAVETALANIATLPLGPPRAPLLRADLAAMGVAAPPPLPFADPHGEAAAFGTAYVIEGSRLGGALLERRVPPALPRAYLSAVHAPGAWRRFGAMLDTAAETGQSCWLNEAITAAKMTFALYARAAEQS